MRWGSSLALASCNISRVGASGERRCLPFPEPRAAPGRCTGPRCRHRPPRPQPPAAPPPLSAARLHPASAGRTGASHVSAWALVQAPSVVLSDPPLTLHVRVPGAVHTGVCTKRGSRLRAEGRLYPLTAIQMRFLIWRHRETPSTVQFLHEHLKNIKSTIQTLNT